MKKILLINDSKPAKYTLTASLIRSFEKRNIIVDNIYPNIFSKVTYKHNLVARTINRLIIAFKIKEILLEKQIKSLNLNYYSFILVIKGAYLNKSSLFYLRKSNKPVVCYNPDDPYLSSSKIILNNIKYYDIYFIWSKNLCKKIHEKEKIKTSYLPFAADLEIHNLKKHNNIVKKKYPISFIGNWDTERENWLKNIQQKKLLFLFGNNWSFRLKSDELRKSYTGLEVTDKEYAKTVQESIININILRSQNKNSNNMRTFEIPASGGFLLHEYSDEVAELFEEGKEIEFFRDKNELNKKIDFYLKNQKKAEEIAKNAYRKVISHDYTYDARVQTILSEVAKIINKELK